MSWEKTLGVRDRKVVRRVGDERHLEDKGGGVCGTFWGWPSTTT